MIFFLRSLLLLFFCFALTGCLVTYLVRSGYEQIKILNDREPLEKVLKRDDLAPEHRHKLELALEIGNFVQNKLHLNATDNYKTFVDLKRPYVSYIVTAAQKWALESHLYWYPLVGELPYKGYFTKENAENEAKKFDENEYDVMVRGVTAYSTLGWFEDPLLSTMITGEDHHLVNLIIHESTHATLYIKSQADFNEQLATFIGNIGTEIYYREKEGSMSKSLRLIRDENDDEKLFSEFISHEIRDLKEWYKARANNRGPEAESQRQAYFQNIQERFARLVAPKLKTDSYKGFAKMKLNNATLLYFKTYVFDLSDFEKLYEHFDRDLEKFVNFCKGLEKNPDPRHAMQTYLAAASASAAASPPK